MRAKREIDCSGKRHTTAEKLLKIVAVARPPWRPDPVYAEAFRFITPVRTSKYRSATTDGR